MRDDAGSNLSTTAAVTKNRKGRIGFFIEYLGGVWEGESFFFNQKYIYFFVLVEVMSNIDFSGIFFYYIHLLYTNNERRICQNQIQEAQEVEHAWCVDFFTQE